MKNDALLMNTSRDAVVNETALIDALKKKKKEATLFHDRFEHLGQLIEID